MTIFLVSSCIQRKQLGYTRDGIQGYTHFKNKEPFAIYSDCHDTCFVKMVDLQAEQEAGYMVTIISQKKDFFYKIILYCFLDDSKTIIELKQKKRHKYL